jgi:NFU1 iron-sulfur cluster scaffold homolog, mitochondrial
MLFVQDVDLTPNPQALKFILNESLLKFETRNFASRESAQADPLARGLFEIPGVVTVFYMDRFITIEKEKASQWGPIQKQLVEFVKSFDKDLLPEEKGLDNLDEQTNEILKQINMIIDSKVRPALANDGGGLEILGMEGFRVNIRYQGACGSCPSAIQGTLMAIENLLKRDIHPSIEVVADN